MSRKTIIFTFFAFVMGTGWYLLSLQLPIRSRTPHRNSSPKRTKLVKTQTNKQPIRIISKSSPARSVRWKRVEIKRALHKLSKHLKKQAVPFGVFSDGTRLLGLKDPKEHLHPPKQDSEQASGYELYRLQKSGTLTRLAPNLLATNAKIASHTGRVALITKHRQLYVSDKDGAPPYRMLTHKAGFHPSFDPKGEQLAYTKQHSMDTQFLVIQDIRSGQTRTIAQGASGISNPSFRPDGSELIFSSNQTGILSMWRVQLPDGAPIQVTNRGIQPGAGLPPHFIPAPAGNVLWFGARIVYNTGDAIWTIRSDGTGAKALSGAAKWFGRVGSGRKIKVILLSGKAHILNVP